MGLDLNSFQVGIEADGDEYPGLDFVGNIEFYYLGLLLYEKLC